jgi:CheY-like chemotaxis protein
MRASAPSAPESTVRTEPARSGLVLYIEDNVSNVHLIERIFRQRPGIEVLHAPNGQTAFQMVRERCPDLVLLDLHLPDMSGEEVLHHLWADPASRRVPIIMVTADATPGLARRLIAGGARACVTKPLHVKGLLELVDTLINDPANAVAMA